MSNIASITSVVSRFGPVVRRSVPYLIVAAVVTAVATALFFGIKKVVQFYDSWRVTFHDEVVEELDVQFKNKKIAFTKQLDDQLKRVKQEAAEEIEKVKVQAYLQLQKGQRQIEELMPKTVKKGPFVKTDKYILQLVSLVKAGNPLVILESLLKDLAAFATVQKEWEMHFVEAKEDVIAYLPQFLKGRGDPLLLGAKDALSELSSNGSAKEFVEFVQKNHTAEEIYAFMKADKTGIIAAFKSGDLDGVEANALKCIEMVFASTKDELKNLYNADQEKLKPMIQTLVAKLESEVEGQVAIYLDAFLNKVGIDIAQIVNQPLLGQLQVVVQELADKELGFVLKQLTNEKNWAAVVTLLIHFLT